MQDLDIMTNIGDITGDNLKGQQNEYHVNESPGTAYANRI